MEQVGFLNIRDINNAYEGVSLTKYPSAGPLKWAWYRFFSRSARVEMPLNWFWYKREDAVRYMEDKFGFRDYGSSMRNPRSLRSTNARS